MSNNTRIGTADLSQTMTREAYLASVEANGRSPFDNLPSIRRLNADRNAVLSRPGPSSVVDDILSQVRSGTS